MNLCRALLGALLLCLYISVAGAQTLLPNGMQTFVDPNGAPLSGGKIYFYVPGTTTPKLTWQDSALSTPNTNPVTLDSAGRAIIWGNGSYRQIVQDSLGNLQWDQITTAPASSTSSSSPSTPPQQGKSFTADLINDVPLGVSLSPIVFTRFEFDTVGGYSTTTGAFQPLVRGQYLVTATLYLQGTGTGSAGDNCFGAIFRNGVSSRVAASQVFQNLTSTFSSIVVTGIFQLNGSTDSLQVKANCPIVTTLMNVKSGTNLSYISAAWLGNY